MLRGWAALIKEEEVHRVERIIKLLEETSRQPAQIEWRTMGSSSQLGLLDAQSSEVDTSEGFSMRGSRSMESAFEPL
jgi:hypothetical protein